MVVHRRGDMIDIAKIASRQPLPSGPRVRIITNSLTLAHQMLQKMDSVGLIRDPEPELLGADADPEAFARAAREALADQRYDSVVCAAVNAFDQGTEDIILALENVAAEATKPLVGVFLDFHPPLMSSGEADTPGCCPGLTDRSMPSRRCQPSQATPVARPGPRRSADGGSGHPSGQAAGEPHPGRAAGWS